MSRKSKHKKHISEQASPKRQSFFRPSTLVLASFITIVAFHIFFRFYQLESRLPFEWDQLDNAWTAKKILIDHEYPLVGMQAKLNSGIFIGPLYYYLVALFYAVFNMNPIAAGVLAGITSLFNVVILYVVLRKLFNSSVALWGAFIYTFSHHMIMTSRIQWPVNFIDVFGMVVFYFLYRIMTGKPKFLLWLALVVGVSFHIHFTSIFYLLIVFLTIPWWPRTKETLRYFLWSIPLFVVWLIPIGIYMNMQDSHSSNFSSYLQTYYHGFHLRRVLQLTYDAVIMFRAILDFPWLRNAPFILLPLFGWLVWKSKLAVERKKLLYLTALYFVVPWFVFATYRGEITDYYFYINRMIVVMILAFTTYSLVVLRYKIIGLVVILFWAYYGYVSLVNQLTLQPDRTYLLDKENVETLLAAGRPRSFKEGDPEWYIHYYVTEHQNKKVE